jgi:hypothetical protein
MSCDDTTDALRARIEVLELLIERERADRARLDMEHIAAVGQAQSALEERDEARGVARELCPPEWMLKTYPWLTNDRL